MTTETNLKWAKPYKSHYYKHRSTSILQMERSGKRIVHFHRKNCFPKRESGASTTYCYLKCGWDFSIWNHEYNLLHVGCYQVVIFKHFLWLTTSIIKSFSPFNKRSNLYVNVRSQYCIWNKKIKNKTMFDHFYYKFSKMMVIGLVSRLRCQWGKRSKNLICEMTLQIVL